MCVKRDRRRQASARGFALYMVLVLITLMAVLMVGASRRTMELSREAGEAGRQLRQRWGEYSLRTSIIRQAPSLLDTQRQAAASLPGSALVSPNLLHSEVTLNSETFRITLADENVKINLNQLDAVGGTTEVSDTLLREIRDQRYLRPPSAVATGTKTTDSAYQSWGQVLQLDRFPSRASAAAWLPDHTQTLTCWGDGTLNIRRADVDTIYTVCRRLAAPKTIAALVQLRQEEDFEAWELREILDKLELRASERVKLRKWLRTESTTYSLWLASSSQLRTHLTFTVTERDGSGRDRLTRFVW